MKVMIIDSATEARRQIRMSIGAIPCEVCESASAEDAIQQCDRFQPDCLTIGLRLAGMSGFSAMRVLRALCPTARMIVVAEMDSVPVRRLARAAGASHFVPREDLRALAGHLRDIDRHSASRRAPQVPQ
jgi:DNA-binding NarL/FixJ family response regulator